MAEETVIEVTNLTKKYRLGVYGSGTLNDHMKLVWSRFRGKPNPLSKIGDERSDGKIFWALKDISFKVNKGEIIGIIGRNGAGKSTLLKIISQISSPTEGEIKIKGRIASLLEVGTGFHPELTGRENIFLNGAILGMSKVEIKSKLEEIIDFSGIEHHIDTPVKRYSSGMKVRLGFAVAAHLEPEILIIDEVLAVGDAEFQSKCIGKMQDVAGSGRTILFVSHNLSAVRNLCHRGIVLNEGKIVFNGQVNDALSHYAQIGSGNDDFCIQKNFNTHQNQIAQLTSAKIEQKISEHNYQFEFSESIKIEVGVQINSKKHDTFIGTILEDIHGNMILVSTNEENGIHHFSNIENGKYIISFTLPAKLLKPGIYVMTLSIRGDVGKAYQKEESCLRFEIIDTITFRGLKERYRKQAVVAPEIDWELIK